MTTTNERRLEKLVDTDTGIIARMTRLLNISNRRDHNISNLIDGWEKAAQRHAQISNHLKDQAFKADRPEDYEELRDRSEKELALSQHYTERVNELKEANNVEP